jgi:putative ATPase
VVGQTAALKSGSPLRRLIEGDFNRGLNSIVLWGPPGSGKTTLARLVASSNKAKFVELSAISASVAQVRDVIDQAKTDLQAYDKQTVLFLDEIHRFSKSQQDALLGAVESGVLTLIAATTENPSFSIIKPLISRSLVVNLTPLSDSEVRSLLLRALSNDALVSNSKFSDAALDFIVKISSGDARRALSLLEAAGNSSTVEVGIEEIKQIAQNSIAYDDGGDSHYDTISAFIKSVRGSDVDSALHYLARMIVGGEDPRFISRRLMILAAEDIGLADPNALVLAEAAASVVEKIGMPEGRIPLAEATIYLALAPKSNSSYLAIDKAIEQVRDGFAPEVPAPLRSTGAVGYKYPHDHSAGIVKQDYSLAKDLFSPGELGYEKTLAERLRAIRRVLNGE